MMSYSVDLDQMLMARERRASIQNKMMAKARPDQCLVCLTLNIAGEVKRTPMTRMLFDEGVKEFEALGLELTDSFFIDEATGSEALWIVNEEGTRVKPLLEELEDSFAAARLFDFDVIVPGGQKLSRAAGRRCLICDRPAAECSRSRRHGLEEVKWATGRLLKEFCAEKLAQAAHGALLDELYTTPKPGLVDMNNNGAHADMDVPLFEKSADALIPYFRDAALLGMNGCGMESLRERGKAAETEMFAATGGINTHKGLVYSMGLLLAGMGRSLSESEVCADDTSAMTATSSCIACAAALAKEDASKQLEKSMNEPTTNGGAVYKAFGAKGATGEAAAGFPGALYCGSRLSYYRQNGFKEPGTLALCDSMAVLEDTNLLHRGGGEGLEHVKNAASRICEMPEAERPGALSALDKDLIARNLSPGGSADMLALAFLLERWQRISDTLFVNERGDQQ